MDLIRAKEIISALAEGIDPTTGEVLESNHVCNKAEVVRAFYTVLENLPKAKSKFAPENTGKQWTKEDDELLIALYTSDASRRDICKALKRTIDGVAARLVRLGLIKDRSVFRERK